MATLFNLLNQSNYYFYFLVVDEFLDITLPELKNFISISPQSLNIKLREKNSGLLLSHPKVLEFIKKNTPNSFTPAIIPFKPSSKLELICKKNHWLLVANPAKINRLYEDKIKFAEICQTHHLPQIPNVVAPLTLDNFNHVQKKFGHELVIQTHFGWAGNSTFFAKNYDDATKQILPSTLVKFSPLLPGYSLLNNCCLTKFGLIQSPPALQYTGLPALTQNPFATTGRQWPSLAPATIQEQVKKITENFSSILQQQNFRGFFGLDFFVYQDQVYLLECNPRLTASFAFYTSLELKHHLNPLFLFHLLEFINLNYSVNLDQEKNRFDLINFVGSEITKKDIQGKTVKKYHDFMAFSPSNNPISISSEIISRVL